MIKLCKVYPLLSFLPWLFIFSIDLFNISIIPVDNLLTFYVLMFAAFFLFGFFLFIKYHIIGSNFPRAHQKVAMLLALSSHLFVVTILLYTAGMIKL